MQEKTKQCPQCKGDILISATKCKHYGSDLRSRIVKHPFLSGLAFLFILGFLVSKFGIEGRTLKQEVKSNVSINIQVTSQVVKKVDGKCRYFFDIRNNDSQSFAGDVKIQLINGMGDEVSYETFSTKSPIAPDIGTSQNFDANTCPKAIHGDYGIVSFGYKVYIDGKIANEGSGDISNKFENLD